MQFELTRDSEGRPSTIRIRFGSGSLRPFARRLRDRLPRPPKWLTWPAGAVRSMARVIRTGLPRAHQRADPGVHGPGRRNESGHPAEFEMRVRVDQPGQERNVAEVARRLGTAPLPQPDNASALDVDPSAINRRAIDRQDPASVEDQCASRAVLCRRAAALRAS